MYKRVFFVMLVVGLILGCQGTSMSLYISADRATYEAIAPEYLDYISSDDALDKEQKARRVRLIKTWDRRIEEAEGALEESNE